MAPRPLARDILHPAALWGVFGVIAILLDGIVRLAIVAVDSLTSGLTDEQWAATVVVWLFFGAAEGYRGFQKAFSPRVVARAAVLPSLGRGWLMWLAPLYCMGLLVASRRRLIANWMLVFGIVGLIIWIRALPPVWRGIIDSGVVIGLSWGTVAIAAFFVREVRGHIVDVPLDLPKNH